MSEPDFQHYRSIAPDLTERNTSNTLMIGGPLAQGYKVTRDTEPDSTAVIPVDLHELDQALKRMADHHVVYVSAPFAVAEGDTAGWHPGTCVPNCNYEGINRDLPAALRKFESIHGCYPFAGTLVPSA